MYIKNLKMRDIKNMKDLALDYGIFNTEALMLVFPKKSFPDGVTRVFKYINIQEFPDLMDRKKFTVVTLNQLEEYLAIRSLVIPDTLVYINGSLVGFSLPLIPEHKNVGKMLNSNIPFEEKRDYLKQIGDIIEKVQSVKDEKYRLQFGDLNEYNFIMNRKGTIKAVDLDSSYLGVGEPSDMVYYLLRNPYIRHIPDKYPTTIRLNIIPNDDTDLFCYNMMILKALSGEDFSPKSREVFDAYIDYLRTLDIPSEYIESLEVLYSNKPNLNPRESLMGISSSTAQKMDYSVFQKKK